MRRPETLGDVLSLVRQSRLVDEARLAAFLKLLQATGFDDRAPNGILSLMTEQGLLTTYQASELSSGRCDEFQIGPYRILDQLGRGAMGRVYLCEHTLMGRRVAVKVLSNGLQSDPTARRRFAKEARAAAALDHKNVVRVFDIEAASEPAYLVMEYVDGLSWQSAVVRHGPFSTGEAAVCGAQVARGLQAIAEAGLIHRDVKPANLLIDRDGWVKILDLGIVRINGEMSIALDGRMVLGTLDYLAPEQAEDSSAVDIRADLYSLGATLYFMLAGHPPFPDGDVEEKLALKQSAEPAPLDRARPDVPLGLAAVVHKLLARDPADRYATPTAVVEALQPWAEPPANFPARLFVPLAMSGLSELGRATDAGWDRDSTSVCMTRRITRPNQPADTAEEEVDFNCPPTDPIPIPGAALVEADADEGPTRPPRSVWPASIRGRLAAGAVALVLLASLVAWGAGCFNARGTAPNQELKPGHARP